MAVPRWFFAVVLLLLVVPMVPAQPTKLKVIEIADGPKGVEKVTNSQVELSLPLKINDKEQLVAWVGYAMRLMASRINVTLAEVEDQMEPERYQKLVNSTALIVKLIDKIVSGAVEQESAKLTPMMNGSKEGSRKKSDDHKLNIEKELPRQNKLTVEHVIAPNPSFSKYINELAMMNPFEQQDTQIFRDPDVFPPYADAKTRLLPLEMMSPMPVYKHTTENSRNFYSLLTSDQNSSGIGLAGKQDSPSSVHVVNLHQVFTNPKSSGFDPMGFQQSNSAQSRPALAVPFEAYVTITRDRDPTPPPAAPTTPPSNPHPAAIILNNYVEPVKKLMESRKTTVTFDDVTTYKPPMDKKKKKTTMLMPMKTSDSKNKKNKKKQPNLLQSFIRVLISNRTSTAIPSLSDLFARYVTKKMPNLKKQKQLNRGKRNETFQKQIDDDDDGRFGSDANVNNNDDGGADDDDDDGGGGGGGNTNANDIFDDFDDDFDKNNDDYDYAGGGGSLGSLEDLLPLIIPILEDISDPESDTDLGEFLQAAIPLLQGLSEPDPETGEGPDIVGVLGPILQNLSAGKDGQGSDSGAILGPLVQLLAPFIGPLSGPLIGPLSASSSGGEGSSIGALLGALITPLSKPTDYGGKSPIAGLVADITAILLKELSKPDSGIDLGAVVSQLVTGALSGTSAGLSGDLSKGKSPAPYGPAPAYHAPAAQVGVQNLQGLRPPKLQQEEPSTFRPPRQQQRPTKKRKKPSQSQKNRVQATVYRPQATHPDGNPVLIPIPAYNLEQLAAPAGYGTYGVPAHKVNPFDILGKAFKDILSSSVNLITSLVGGSTAASGASSMGSSSLSDSGGGHDAYGPPPSSYGPPSTTYQKPSSYQQDSYQNIH